MEKNSREGESNFLNFFVAKQKKKKEKKDICGYMLILHPAFSC